MIKLIDIVYYSHTDHKDPREVIQKHAPSIGFAGHIKYKANLQFVKHMDYEGKLSSNGVEYMFFKRRNSFWQIPPKTHKYIKACKPDVVIVEGLIFPLQVISLRLAIGKKIKIICQHHGEKPYGGIKLMLQKFADRYIDAYMFTALGNAGEWLEKKVIKSSSKCAEILEASTYFSPCDKEDCRKILGLMGNPVFLWVGRLNENKDPLTVLKAFKRYVSVHDEARLYMIYKSDVLLPEIKKLLMENEQLKSAVILIGPVSHNELMEWYSAADFYITGSHKEGSGYALIEAIACGCIPVVTDISSFRKLTKNGRYGFLYPPSDIDGLMEVLMNIHTISRKEFSETVSSYFKSHHSFKNIADDTLELCQRLTGK